MLISIHLSPLPWARKPYSPVSTQGPDTKDYCVTAPGTSAATAGLFCAFLLSFLVFGNRFCCSYDWCSCKASGYVVPGNRGDKCQGGMKGPRSETMLGNLRLRLHMLTHTPCLPGVLFPTQVDQSYPMSLILTLTGQKKSDFFWSMYMLKEEQNNSDARFWN